MILISSYSEVLKMIKRPNEKIVLLRKKHGITQKKLSYGILSASTLCSIEKGKFKLSRKNAELIIDRFHEIFIDKNIDDRIDIDWLLEDINYQITKKINLLIKDLFSSNVNIDSSSDYISDNFYWHKGVIKLNFALGGYYYSRKDYDKAKPYYLKTIKYSLALKDFKFFKVAILYFLRINYFLNCNEESLQLYDKHFHSLKNDSNELGAMILYNFALVFHCLKKYDIAISLYQKVPNYTIKEFLITNSETNKGFCLQEIKEYELAIKIFRTLITKTSNIDVKIQSYCNIISCSRKSKNLILCKTTVERLERLIKGISPLDLYQTYYTLGLGHLYLNNIDSAIKYFKAEVLLGCDLGNVKYHPTRYLESIKYLLVLLSKRNLKEILELKDIILQIPYSLLNQEFMLFVIKRYDELLLRNETTELINKFYKKSKECIL